MIADWAPALKTSLGDTWHLVSPDTFTAACNPYQPLILEMKKMATNSNGPTGERSCGRCRSIAFRWSAAKAKPTEMNPIRLRPTHTSFCAHAIYPVATHNAGCHIEGVEMEIAMQYRAQVEGFTGHFETCEALKSWVVDLDRKFHLKGSTVLIWKAKAVTGQVATYTGNPDREIVIGGQS